MSTSKDRAKAKGDRIRSTLDGLASGLFPDRPFSGILKTMAKRIKERPSRNTQDGSPAPANIKERFGANRPNILGSFFNPPEPKKPVLTEAEQQILLEREKQLLEDAEARKKAEAEKKKTSEHNEAVARAKETMSVQL